MPNTCVGVEPITYPSSCMVASIALVPWWLLVYIPMGMPCFQGFTRFRRLWNKWSIHYLLLVTNEVVVGMVKDWWCPPLLLLTPTILQVQFNFKIKYLFFMVLVLVDCSRMRKSCLSYPTDWITILEIIMYSFVPPFLLICCI